MEIGIKIATTNKDKERCFSVRKEVFVREQNISEKVEFDDLSREVNLLQVDRPPFSNRQPVHLGADGDRIVLGGRDGHR